MEYVIDHRRVVAVVPDGEGSAIATDGQVVASMDHRANWTAVYRRARMEVGDALSLIETEAAVRDLHSAAEAGRVLRQLSEEIDQRLK